MAEELICPKDGRPIDQKWIGKWSDKLWLAYCHCGRVHELVPLGTDSSYAPEKK